MIKIIFIAMEIACIISVIVLSFTKVSEEYFYFRAAYISLFAILAVIFEYQQQQIEWDEEK